MKKIFVPALFLALLTTAAEAASIRIVNLTGTQLRIADLHDLCGGTPVPRDTPVYLEDKEEFVAQDISLVMHHYRVCASGMCLYSPLGIKEDREYVLEVFLDDAGVVDSRPLPDHWVGNDTCQ